MEEQNRIHKFWLQKLLIALVDNSVISQSIHFKGGTAANMLGCLDRFSVDLDFDVKKGTDTKILQRMIEKQVKQVNLDIKNKNRETLFYVLKYKTKKENQRNTLKLSFFDGVVKTNVYKPHYLPEIDRLVNCQTIETMFANKLVAPIDRFKRHGEIAGRDIYDIYYFFLQGYRFKEEIIMERTGLETKAYLSTLIKFIESEITDKILADDLNTLLPYEVFLKVRKTLKSETLIFLRSAVSTPE